MGAVLVTVGVVGALAACVRIGVGFIRWVRRQPGDAALLSLGVYLQDALGAWVDDVNESPGWSSGDDCSSRSDDGSDTSSHSAGHGCDSGVYDD